MLSGGATFFLPCEIRPCSQNDILLCFHEGTALLGAEPCPKFPKFSMLAPFFSKDATPFYAFTLPHGNVYVLDTEAPLPLSELPGLGYAPVGVFRELSDEEDALLLVSAWHLMVWRRHNRFCGACGATLQPSLAERALCCPSCGRTAYPIISPAVSVAVTDGDRLLLARNSRATFANFSLVAGYVEVGETLEETVAREVMEEVGLRVKNIRYIGSQAWGFSQAEMIGFHAELDGNDRITLQESELSEARWFHRSEIEPRANPLSLSFEMIERFRQGIL